MTYVQSKQFFLTLCFCIFRISLNKTRLFCSNFIIIVIIFLRVIVATIAVVPVVSLPLCVHAVNARVSLKTVNVKSRQCKYNREVDWNDALETATMKHACGRCAKSSASDKNLQQLRVPLSPLCCEWKKKRKRTSSAWGRKQNKTEIKQR